MIARRGDEQVLDIGTGRGRWRAMRIAQRARSEDDLSVRELRRHCVQSVSANVPTDAERDQACAEIARVLKPGGTIVLSDFIHTKHYTEEFRKAGLEVERRGWYPLLRVVYATKPPTSK